jgi:hypothetical protein
VGDSRPVSAGNPAAGAQAAPGRLLVLALLLQTGLGAQRAGIVVSELTSLAPPLLSRSAEPGASSSSPGRGSP